MADKKEVLRLLELAHQARRDLCKLCGMYSGNIHMGGDMSMIDVLTCLFHRTMQVGPDLVLSLIHIFSRTARLSSPS